MARMNFRDSFSKSIEKDKDNEKKNYELKVLKQICPFIPGLTMSRIYGYYADYKEHQSLAELKYEWDVDILKGLYIKKLKGQTVDKIMEKGIDSKVIKELLKLLMEEGDNVSLVFPLTTRTNGIAHTRGVMVSEGTPVLFIPSSKLGMQDIVIEPLSRFINSRLKEKKDE